LLLESIDVPPTQSASRRHAESIRWISNQDRATQHTVVPFALTVDSAKAPAARNAALIPAANETAGTESVATEDLAEDGIDREPRTIDANDSIPSEESSWAVKAWESKFQNEAFDTEHLQAKPRDSETPLWRRMLRDQANFYAPESSLPLAAAFGIGAAFANTQLDQQLQNHFQSSVRGATSREWFEFLHANKELGDGLYTLPVLGGAWIAGEVFNESESMQGIGLWGERSIRGFVVGAPAVVVLQRLTGGPRPDETPEGSEWHPMQDNNGVSGHAFMSALPFITAAKLTDRPLPKALFYLGSTIGPLSRVNDGAHYPSQIGLGWVMAYFAATAVQQTDTGKRGWSLIPQSTYDGNGFALQYRW
jgi:hypothetical protein